MKYKIFFIVIFCFVCSTIARRKHQPTPSEFSCPKSCDCYKLNYYKESKCTRNGSSLELILRRTSVFNNTNFNHIRGNHLIVNCTTGDHFPYEILPEFNFVNLVFLRYNGCPLPQSKSFSRIHPGIFELHFNTTENISLTKEYFNGLENLQGLYLKSTSTINLADDVFTDQQFLNDLTIISNEINEIIFERPSNVTTLTHGRTIGEFSSEVVVKWKQLASISLTNSKIKHLTKKFFINLPQIRSVSLIHSEINSFVADAFESLEQLKLMSLKYNKIVDMPNCLITNSNYFEYIRIECDENTRFDTLPDEFLSNIPTLKTVYIMHCNMKSVPENLLKNSTDIYDLYMRDNLLTDLPENFLANQTNFGHINLSSNKFGKHSDTFFENVLSKQIWGREDRFYIYFMSNEIESLSQKDISYLSQFNGYFDFRNNSIADISGFDGLVKGHEGSFINLESNPINCDCLSVKAYKEYSTITPGYYQGTSMPQFVQIR